MTESNAFLDGTHAPARRELDEVLGARAEYWHELTAHVAPPPTEAWKYYGKKYGWTLKLLVKKRNLCFLTARDGWFVVGFVFGDRAVPAVVASALPRALVQELVDARKYAEGRGIRIEVKSRRALEHALILLDIKQAT
ncbi:MAG: DUF3788 family protein [Gemmatimonadaceae bacterium]